MIVATTPCAALSGVIGTPSSTSVPCAVPWYAPFADAKTTKSDEPFGVDAGAVILSVSDFVLLASTITSRVKSTQDDGTPDVERVNLRKRSVGFVKVTVYEADGPGATVCDAGLIATAFWPTTDVAGRANAPGVPA